MVLAHRIAPVGFWRGPGEPFEARRVPTYRTLSQLQPGGDLAIAEALATKVCYPLPIKRPLGPAHREILPRTAPGFLAHPSGRSPGGNASIQLVPFLESTPVQIPPRGHQEVEKESSGRIRFISVDILASATNRTPCLCSSCNAVLQFSNDRPKGPWQKLAANSSNEGWWSGRFDDESKRV